MVDRRKERPRWKAHLAVGADHPLPPTSADGRACPGHCMHGQTGLVSGGPVG